jgi:hypothetical protein
MARRVNSALTGNGHRQIHWPGAYAHVLQQWCREDATQQQRQHGSSLCCETDEQLAQWRRDYEQRFAALMEQRMCEPVSARSYQLPDGLPEPFERWPKGGQRTFVVGPDDVIALRTMGAWR